MSGCERGWHGYPFYTYPQPQNQPQWSHNPDYCGVPQANPATPQQSHYMGYNDPSGFVGGVIPSCPPHYWDGDELVDAYGRVVKRKSSANKKERRRTQSINNAFAELRDCIPNVPADTKLSKIKTLRLATSYIAYLMRVLRADIQDNPTEDFKAEIPLKRKSHSDTEKDESSDSMEIDTTLSSSGSPTSSLSSQKPSLIVSSSSSTSSAASSALLTISSSSSHSPSTSTYSSSIDRRRSRTGWPEAVWAQELKF